MVITNHEIVDAVLACHATDLGASATTYRHHVLRSLNYHALLQGHEVSEQAALAWAVHDLGIWTAGTFDYLEPSAALAQRYGAELGVTEVDRSVQMVTEHHKLRSHADLETEAFRKADLVDVSHGLIRFGIPRAEVTDVVRALPYEGFHRFLAKGLTGHAVRHPTKPAPMMRW
ncbi:MAG: hypothetical protein L0H31_06110 [Nocardioidaceae bacterium]|nr:hypothetical protein [Nocardioidaceae bacterium]